MMAPMWPLALFLVPLAHFTTGQQTFSTAKLNGAVDESSVNEISGCAASRKFPDVLYVHNDHGDRPRLFAINAQTARVLAEFQIQGAQNHAWEDIAVGPCDTANPQNGTSCIYILDDGIASGPEARTVYKIEEPSTLTDHPLSPDSVLRYNWTEPGSDVLMVDPNGELFIIGYVTGGRGMIVHLPNTAWDQPKPVYVSSKTFFASYTGGEHDPVGGDISPDGREMLIRTHHNVYYWSVPTGDYIDTLETSGTPIPHHTERTPGAICWSSDGSKFYTIGEGRHAPVYSYNKI